MDYLRFFFGSGWLISWYFVFYIAGVLPSLVFLGFFRRSRTFGPGEGLALTYSIGTTLLLFLSAINGFLMAKGLQGVSLIKYPLVILGAVCTLVIFRAITTRYIIMDKFDRRYSWVVHALLFSLMFLNLYSLWVFQNRHAIAA